MAKTMTLLYEPCGCRRGQSNQQRTCYCCTYSGELVISYDHYANDHSPVLKGISVSKYKTDFTLIATYDIVPDQKLLDKASAIKPPKRRAWNTLNPADFALDGGNFLLIAEYRIVQIVKTRLPVR